MGAAYAAGGPWLAEDPYLFTATGPPAPAAWLWDVALHAVERSLGFTGLRVAHAALVAGVLAMVWGALRRAGGSASLASLGTALFAALSAYRLFQLRPHLFTILAALAIYRLLIEDGRVPSWRRVAASVLLFALWANTHGAFLLGPVLLASALGGLLVSAALLRERRASDLPRAARLAAALALGGLATLVNPTGVGQHLRYFAAGGQSPALGIVSDEWAPVALFALPQPNLPPSPLAWAIVWGLVLATPLALVVHAPRRGGAAARPTAAGGFDPGLAALALTSLLGSLSAVRLLWLGIFPLLAIARALRARGPAAARARIALWGPAALALLLVPGFARFGDWPMISQGVRREGYARPYPALKYHAHAVWFLRDAGLEANLFTDYLDGNFLGYWLAPRLRVFLNASLNVPPSIMEAHHAILQRRGARAGEGFLAALDRLGIDAFFGSGLPVVSRVNRPVASTTGHLEGAPGWLPVFRTLDAAVYLRDVPSNRQNLARVADYYARAGIPFDVDRGFDVARVASEAPDWAVRNGLLPRDFAGLARAASGAAPEYLEVARERLALLFAAIGLYERALAVDRAILADDPGAPSAARRTLWSLLRLGRLAEALDAAERLAANAPPDDELARLLVQATRRLPALAPADAASLVAALPVFTRAELPILATGFEPPEARRRRD